MRWFGGVDRRDVRGSGGLYSRDELPAGRRGEAGGPSGGGPRFVRSLSLSPLQVGAPREAAAA